MAWGDEGQVELLVGPVDVGVCGLSNGCMFYSGSGGGEAGRWAKIFLIFVNFNL